MPAPRSPGTPLPTLDDPVLRSLIDAARADDHIMTLLEELCDDYGARPAGSPAYDAAARWAIENLRPLAWTEEVTVPVWRRGEERLEMLAPVPRSLAVLGLGGTVGAQGLEAPVAVVHSFDELSPQVAGHIVVFDVPMEEGVPSIQRYGPAVQYRTRGAARAAEQGAVAALVRSVTTRSLYTLHTGGMRYDDAVTPIPTASITTEDAAMLSRLVARGKEVRLRLTLDDGSAGEAPCRNVLAEIKGSERPDEIVLVGAHLDSWDVGQGANDDGAGVVQVMELMRLLADQHPRRTVRAVLFANEEAGLNGGMAYAEVHGVENHVAAIETDLGHGWPLAWSVGGTSAQRAWLAPLAAPLALPLEEGEGGADIGPVGKRGTLVVGLLPDDSHYFDVHHTRADTFEKIDPASLKEGLAALVALTWQLATADSPPPRLRLEAP